MRLSCIVVVIALSLPTITRASEVITSEVARQESIPSEPQARILEMTILPPSASSELHVPVVVATMSDGTRRVLSAASPRFGERAGSIRLDVDLNTREYTARREPVPPALLDRGRDSRSRLRPVTNVECDDPSQEGCGGHGGGGSANVWGWEILYITNAKGSVWNANTQRNEPLNADNFIEHTRWGRCHDGTVVFHNVYGWCGAQSPASLSTGVKVINDCRMGIMKPQPAPSNWVELAGTYFATLPGASGVTVDSWYEIDFHRGSRHWYTLREQRYGTYTGSVIFSEDPVEVPSCGSSSGDGGGDDGAPGGGDPGGSGGGSTVPLDTCVPVHTYCSGATKSCCGETTAALAACAEKIWAAADCE